MAKKTSKAELEVILREELPSGARKNAATVVMPYAEAVKAIKAGEAKLPDQPCGVLPEDFQDEKQPAKEGDIEDGLDSK